MCDPPLCFTFLAVVKRSRTNGSYKKDSSPTHSLLFYTSLYVFRHGISLSLLTFKPHLDTWNEMRSPLWSFLPVIPPFWEICPFFPACFLLHNPPSDNYRFLFFINEVKPEHSFSFQELTFCDELAVSTDVCGISGGWTYAFTKSVMLIVAARHTRTVFHRHVINTLALWYE